MGNRNLRVQVAKALKAKGYPKLYKKRSKYSYRYLDAAHLKALLWFLQLESGTLVNDCDGFNHRVESAHVHRISWLGIMVTGRVKFKDGRYSCGCPSSPVPAWSQKEVEAFHKNFLQERPDLVTPKDKERLIAGLPLSDSDGVRLKDSK